MNVQKYKGISLSGVILKGCTTREVTEEMRGGFRISPPTTLREDCKTNKGRAVHRIRCIAARVFGADDRFDQHHSFALERACKKDENGVDQWATPKTIEGYRAGEIVKWSEDEWGTVSGVRLSGSLALGLVKYIESGGRFPMERVADFAAFAESEIDRADRPGSPHHPGYDKLIRAFLIGVGVRKGVTQIEPAWRNASEYDVADVYNLLKPCFTRQQFAGALKLAKQVRLCLCGSQRREMDWQPRTRDLKRISTMSDWGVRAVICSLELYRYTSFGGYDLSRIVINWDGVARIMKLSMRRRKLHIMEELKELNKLPVAKFSHWQHESTKTDTGKCLPRSIVCKLVHGKPAQDVFGSQDLSAAQLSDVHCKTWRRLAPFFADEKCLHQPVDAAMGAYKAYQTFGKDAIRWMEKTKSIDCNWDELPWHAATHWLPVEPAPEFGAWLLKRYQPKDQTPTRSLAVIANNWDSTFSAMSISNALAAARKAMYNMSGIHADIVDVVAETELSQSQAEEFGRIWENRHKPSYKTVPAPGLETGVIRLHDNDPRGPLLGLYTGCCQHPWSAGASCAAHGSENKDGAFWAIFAKGIPVAQCWVWRSGDALCLDSIEIRYGFIDRDEAVSRMVDAAKSVIGVMCVELVVGGKGFRSLPGAGGSYLNSPSGVYSDAGSQKLLAWKE